MDWGLTVGGEYHHPKSLDIVDRVTGHEDYGCSHDPDKS